MEKFSDHAIIESWRKNIVPWVNAIKNNEITSRIEVTNRAVLDAILKHRPVNLLDIGCGEGWLIREVSRVGVDCTGMDVLPEFAQYVKNSGGKFKEISYEDFSPGAFNEKFDVIVCNFSLLGKESVEHIIKQSTGSLKTHGTLIIQTVHPHGTSNQGNHTDGWREGSWQGFGKNFIDPAPWYFRTTESWKALLNNAGFNRINITEPCRKKTGIKLSILFEACKGV